MYLREIVISGFKSFADRTRFDLREGMTAVVGPNGCGKSNIVDAIRWVLGEQSAKALRGGSMQDVIFEGTEDRKPIPVCEVTLTFTDCEDELGTAFNEVEVSRRVTRDGGSDYYLNGKVSRLKDIQRLFANTGVGRVSYSFMVQGQIDQVLSTNPAERRTIFEEAAGITLYKSQRKEAMNKLSLVDANLSRVTDVIDEVSRQIGSLKRQATKALRYQRVKHRVTHLDLARQARRHAEAQASIRTIEAKAETLRAKLEERNASLEEDERALEAKKSERAELADATQEAQQRVYTLRSEKDNAENQASLSETRADDLASRIAEYEKEIEDLERQREELSDKAESESENKQRQLDDVDASDRAFKERDAELKQAQERLDELENALQERRQAVLEAENRIHRARSKATTLEVDLKSYQVKHSDLTERVDHLKRETSELDDGLSDLRERLEQRRRERDEAAEAVETAREHHRSIQTEHQSLQDSIQERDRQLASKSAHLGALEDLQAKHEGLGEGAKAILAGKIGDAVDHGQAIVVSRRLKVAEGYTQALETLLGAAGEALYVGGADAAMGAVRRLREGELGRACLQIDAPGEPASEPEAPPEGVVPAGQAVEARDETLARPLERLLEGCYVARDLDAFMRFWASRPDFRFRLVATSGGELLDSRGLVYGGRSSGKKSPSVLQRESEIHSLKQATNDERKNLETLREQAEALSEKREQAEADVEEKRRKHGELANEVSGLEAEERGQNQKIETNRSEREKAEAELKELEQTRSDSVDALERARQELSDAEKALEQERKQAEDLEARIASAREDRDAKREAVSEVRLELAEKKQRLNTVDRVLDEVERDRSNLADRATQRRQEIDNLNERIRELRETARAEREKSRELEQSLEAANDKLQRDNEALKALDADIARKDNDLSGRRDDARAMERELNQIDVKLAEERSQLGFIERSARDEHQTELDSVDWKRELWEADLEFEKRVNLDDVDDPDSLVAQPKGERREPTEEEWARMDATDWSEVEREVGELKSKIASMGPVNLDAIGEYADLKERYDFLQGQSDDLWNSKNELLRAIDEINETSQTLFRDTFEQIRRNFAFTYDKMSGGGESDLKLVDADDPLESGIEIVARPPGTRLKNVSLLSGGQRTMTAVALLFAIYMVKPSPFCVLDEIDAALDDANIGRFCETLRSFTDRSQFLIITHNKRTIANADTVFGVTMPEKGVSRLISMRLNQETREPEAAGHAG